MTSHSRLSVVIPAAGIGSRMASGTPKQYLKIAGKTVLEHAIDAFIDHPRIQDIIVCLHPDDSVFNTLAIARHHRVRNIVGARTRAESVLNGLKAIAQDANNSWVLVHDAARPGLSQMALNRLISAQDMHSGAILALPVADTIKKAKTCSTGNLSSIASTIDRRHLWQAQTPQMFKVQRLLFALNTALNDTIVITDEASAIEYLGDEVALIEGEAANMKITRPDDLALAAFYLQQRNTQRDPS